MAGVDYQKYLDNAYLQQAQALREELTKHVVEKTQLQMELDIVKKEKEVASRSLQIHEKREKKRADGLKKAQQARKKGAKKNGKT